MLMNWFSQSFQTITASLSTSLNDNDMHMLTLQYCTDLLVAGVIKQLDDKYTPVMETFKVTSLNHHLIEANFFHLQIPKFIKFMFQI